MLSIVSFLYLSRLTRFMARLLPTELASETTTRPADSFAQPSLVSGPPTVPSLPEAFRTIPVAHGASWLKTMLAFAGPGYLVAVGYLDPGNWATDVGSGSRFGYTLLSVILLSN